MNINEMHKLFRTLGQQMGMQLVRGILPDSIDIFINEAINDKIRSILILNTNNDKVLVQNTKISPINSLRTLVCKNEIISNTKESNKFIYTSNILDVFVYTSFSIKYSNNDKLYSCRIINNDDLENTLNDYCNGASFDYPIVCIYSNDDDITFEVYIDNTNYTPEKLLINYIKNPKQVKWSEEPSEYVNCDLPDYLHNEIVQIAINKFRESIGIKSNDGQS